MSNSFFQLNERRQHYELYETKDYDVNDEKSSFQVSAWLLSRVTIFALTVPLLDNPMHKAFYDIKKSAKLSFLTCLDCFSVNSTSLMISYLTELSFKFDLIWRLFCTSRREVNASIIYSGYIFVLFVNSGPTIFSSRVADLKQTFYKTSAFHAGLIVIIPLTWKEEDLKLPKVLAWRVTNYKALLGAFII